MVGRRRLLVLIALLCILDGALVSAFVLRRPVPAAADWIAIDPTDQRMSRVFAAVEQEGLAAALDSLERQAAGDSLVLRGGHQLAHALGRRALTSRGGDASIIGECRPAFASGCYHGVVEGLLSLRGRVDMAELERMCLAAGNEEEPGPVYECVHGLGHGVLGAVGLDVDRALGHCDSLSRSSFVASCDQGVFMEAITSALSSHEGHATHRHDPGQQTEGQRIAIDPDNPYSPCDRYADPYAESCWLFQGFVILGAVGFDPRKALETCDAAAGGRADRCYESVGHQLTGLFQRSDAWVIEQCGKGDPSRGARCASGAALALASMDWTGERVTGFCGTVPGAWSKSCYAAGAEVLSLVASSAQMSELCGRGLPEYSEICFKE